MSFLQVQKETYATQVDAPEEEHTHYLGCESYGCYPWTREIPKRKSESGRTGIVHEGWEPQGQIVTAREGNGVEQALREFHAIIEGAIK